MKEKSINGAVVSALTLYTADKEIDKDAFSGYINFVIEEGAKTILVPSHEGDIGLLTMEERKLLAAEAVRASKGRAQIFATVTESEELSLTEQAKEYLSLGADGLNIRISTADSEAFAENFSQIVLAAGSCPLIIDDNKAGGVDMNNMGRSAASAGVRVETLCELAKKYENLQAVMLNIPLNECGPKCTAILRQSEKRLSVINSAAVDQALEMLDRGSSALVTPVFIGVMNRLAGLFAEGGVDRARPLFFDFLRVIVWCKQFIHRGPYLYELYLKEKGIIADIHFRAEHPIDKYQAAYGREMLKLALDIEEKLKQY